MTSSVKMATRLMHRVLTEPSKIASALDWKHVSGATVLTMTLHTDRIGLAVASHPSHYSPRDTVSSSSSSLCWSSSKSMRTSEGRRQSTEPIPSIRTLPSIPLTGCKHNKIPADGLDELKSLMNDYNVCGVVLSWPMQKDTARMGAECGRVLHALDQIMLNRTVSAATSSDSSVSTTNTKANDMPFSSRNRPICLWTSTEIDYARNREDKWGRCQAYVGHEDGQASPKFHMSSVEQYHQSQNVVAAEVWSDFCRAHWPHLSQYVSEYQDDSDSPSRSQSALVSPSHPSQTRAAAGIDEGFTGGSDSDGDAWGEFYAEHWDDSSNYVKTAAL